VKKHRLVIIAIIFYCLFSFKKEIAPFEGKLFANDFSQKDVAEWLVYSISCYLFLIFIGIIGLRRVGNEGDKLIFTALIIDGIISSFSYIIFGFDSTQHLSILTNSIPLGIIIYSQYIHGKLHKFFP